MSRQDVVWQEDDAVRYFLESVRGTLPLAREQFAAMVDIVANAQVRPGRFLDVGAGDGVLSAVMLAKYPEAQPVLVDFSAPMLAAARDRLRVSGSRAIFVEADLASDAWRDAVVAHAPFAAIVSGFAIHHLEDARKRALYGELLELLAPGGAFAHIEHVAPETSWISRTFDEALVDAIWHHARRHGEATTRDEVAAAHANRPDRVANRLASLEAQLTWLREAGFSEVVAPFRWYEIAVFGGHRPI